MQNIKIQIPDMQSSHCLMRVTNAINKSEGVDIKEIKPGEVEFNLTQEYLDEIVSSIKNAGYTILSIQKNNL
jgi:copper chaperone